MATVMTKRGSQDNVVTYTHVCDTNADMAAINPQYINLGSTCLVVDGESGGLEVYIADSNKEWSMISVAAGGGTGGLGIHICTTTEYDAITKVPTVELPIENTIYLVPNGSTTGDLFVEWIYVDDAWEKIGSIADLSGLVQDVQVNGTSVVQNGVANVPVATSAAAGVVKVNSTKGITISNGVLGISEVGSSPVRQGITRDYAITPFYQHSAAFYGLAKAAGDTTQSASANAVGTYTETAKSKIHDMLNAPETVTGTTPTITAMAGVQYVCGEVSTLDITLPASGCVDIVFESGSSPTILTVTPPTGKTMQWPEWFDPTALDTNTTYELNIMNGSLGVVALWS